MLATAQEWRHEWIAFCKQYWMEVDTKEKYMKHNLSPLVGKQSDAVKVSKNWKNINRELSPLVGERGKREQKRKKRFLQRALNTCLSFLNGRKKRSEIEE